MWQLSKVLRAPTKAPTQRTSIHKHSLGEQEIYEETALPLHVSIKIKVLGLKAYLLWTQLSRIQVDQLQELAADTMTQRTTGKRSRSL